MMSSEALNSVTALKNNLFFVLRNKGHLVGFSYSDSWSLHFLYLSANKKYFPFL